MIFNSYTFLIFFVSVATSYFIIPHRFRWLLLLLASYYFYMCWRPEYIILIIFSTLIDYFAGIKIGQISEKHRRRKYLILSLATNLGLLFSFKYFNFFNDSLRMAFQKFNLFYGVPDFDVLLPVGISFYTFQTLSYTIDVYRGERAPEKHLGIFALYVAFFPQLVAGPIERSTRLLTQFYNRNYFDCRRVTDGLKLMVWGMFKKVVVADRLSLFVDHIYSYPNAFSGKILTVATIFFAFQIYCDFSGYSDIAIGSAKVLGYDLMKNFRRPYFARSIPEFWKRWHISLSTWFRDYLYIPLGGNRVSPIMWHFNIVIVFVLSGLWHGANWTFIIWGLLHGIYYLFSVHTTNIRTRMAQSFGIVRYPNIHLWLNRFVTFTLVCFAWIFFRSNSFSDAKVIVARLLTGWNQPFIFSPEVRLTNTLPISATEFYVSIILIMVVVVFHYLQEHQRKLLSLGAWWFRWGIYLALCLLIMNMGVAEEIPFIYFQF
ncbi:MAG: MBOAT family protein [Candidatus Omnitrophica bacterium]|nr:MBOAT family protein [Candidatus Omnitrophota bacterium]MCB9720490.1 MBOAT family protein [Candidatus Omnitrophota bacterium]